MAEIFYKVNFPLKGGTFSWEYAGILREKFLATEKVEPVNGSRAIHHGDSLVTFWNHYGCPTPTVIIGISASSDSSRERTKTLVEAATGEELKALD